MLGLGFVIVKWVVELYGGNLEIICNEVDIGM